MTRPCQTPVPLYYAVIFTSERTNENAGYDETNDRMMVLAQEMDGFLGVDSAREGVGITVSYWRDLDPIARWRDHAEHRLAKERGRRNWYSAYTVRIARVEDARAFSRTDGP